MPARKNTKKPSTRSKAVGAGAPQAALDAVAGVDDAGPEVEAASPSKSTKVPKTPEEVIREKLKGRFFGETQAAGSASLFELPDEYIFEGLLHPRFVRKNDKSIGKARMANYKFPSELGIGLSDLVRGDLTLMYTDEDIYMERREQHAKKVAHKSAREGNDVSGLAPSGAKFSVKSNLRQGSPGRIPV